MSFDNKTTRFMAGSKCGTGPVMPTPREAAVAFFDRYKTTRKCRVAEGRELGNMFLTSASDRYWRDVTPKTIAEQLPAA